MLKVYPRVSCWLSLPVFFCFPALLLCAPVFHLPLCLYCQSVYFLYSSLVHLFLFCVSCVSCLPLPLPRSSCVLCVTALLSVASDFYLVLYFSSDSSSCLLLFTFSGAGLLDFGYQLIIKLIFCCSACLPAFVSVFGLFLDELWHKIETYYWLNYCANNLFNIFLGMVKCTVYTFCCWGSLNQNKTKEGAVWDCGRRL